MSSTLRIATRKSPLALWQAHYVKHILEANCPGLEISIHGIVTEGDKLLTTPLADIGGKGLFVKELEKALLERKADIAVHSIKDMPMDLPDELTLAAICERDDPRDVFISNQFLQLTDLPLRAIIGTSSSRRTCQIKAKRPDIQVKSLRGNVGTRLMRLKRNEYDAIILAAAGLKRLGEEQSITDYLPIESWIPAVGQGAIGIECHKDNLFALTLLSKLDHYPTRICITAERAMNKALNGGCQLPIAAHATIEGTQLSLRGLVGDLINHTLLVAEKIASLTQAEELGLETAKELLKQGAKTLLNHY